MNGYLRGFTTTVGTKFLVGLTGALLVLFVIGHLLGNLQIYLGPDAINDYAVFLKSKSGLLWGVRLGLLTILIIHVGGIAKLTIANRAVVSSVCVTDSTPSMKRGNSSNCVHWL